MKLIKKITDANFFDCIPSYMDIVTRYASRGIVFNDSNQIAMLYVSNNQSYKLPGGGIEGIETEKEAFLREILEETGYKVEIIEELGIIEEHKIKNNFMQISYCFTSKAISKHEIHLTDHEIFLGMELVWVSIYDAIDIINKCIKSCDDYKMKFMLLRDKTILTIAINKLQHNNI